MNFFLLLLIVQCAFGMDYFFEDIEERTTTKPLTVHGFCHGKKDGKYPHPTQCDQFITCGDVHSCPSGLYFNKDAGRCDYAYNAHCPVLPTTKPGGGKKFNGGWSAWQRGKCSRTCGNGRVVITRTCTNPAPKNGGRLCYGDAQVTRWCRIKHCEGELNGQWSAWKREECSATCGSGSVILTRTCTNPAPKNGGRPCYGDAIVTRWCRVKHCAGEVSGQWSAWKRGKCSTTCGSGSVFLTRTCTNPAPKNGGRECYGDAMVTRWCRVKHCAGEVNGQWSAWKRGECSTTCGTGSVLLTRACTNPAPTNGGRECHGDAQVTRGCRVKRCKGEGEGSEQEVDGGWSVWQRGECSRTCGSGRVVITRTCTNPEPSNGGRLCYGSAKVTRWCRVKHCVGETNGGWSNWKRGECSATCGSGTVLLTRTCTNPAPANGGRPCYGDAMVSRWCRVKHCKGEVNGQWSAWKRGTCSTKCGSGTVLLTRTCTNPAPSNGGRECYGDAQVSRWCRLRHCAGEVNGQWSAWMRGECSTTCGSGSVILTRTCTNPAPENGGRECYGDAKVTRWCRKQHCTGEVNGQWSAWKKGECSATCGSGSVIFTRTCTNPAPSNGGRECFGDAMVTRWCRVQHCAGEVNGQWSDWKKGECSTTCGSGSVLLVRTCTNPEPKNGGSECAGDAEITRWCRKQHCAGEVNGQWSDWKRGECSTTCGSGSVFLTRTCSSPEPKNGGSECAGDAMVTRWCRKQHCIGEVNGQWSAWKRGECSATCGSGSVILVRTCTNPAPKNGGSECAGDAMVTRWCRKQRCIGEVNGKWCKWSPAPCSKTCGDGEMIITRTCTNPAPQHGGTECKGLSEITRACRLKHCPKPKIVNGKWSKWSEGECSTTCGAGEKILTRTCTNPAPQNGGRVCKGKSQVTRYCNLGKCFEPKVVNGKWSRWSEGECSTTCGAGEKILTRTCTNPAPENFGRECKGESQVIRYCNIKHCKQPIKLKVVNGKWSKWSEGECSTTCGAGEKIYTRTCTNPVPQNGGRECKGESQVVRYCRRMHCP